VCDAAVTCFSSECEDEEIELVKYGRRSSWDAVWRQ
jgi:hypothetical protein